ncbi:hypothetical protein C4K04_0058 [Pseudomonas chlororaphis]|uniref:Uncharacterized protein n=1 Tax=Pseudomonas chlororaphis TaxID=587753 RepID=A0A3G7THD2_9PSED|nr:hypothetical protein C4K04_0058 [Pseudomonas chlororaphis]
MQGPLAAVRWLAIAFSSQHSRARYARRQNSFHENVVE